MVWRRPDEDAATEVENNNLIENCAKAPQQLVTSEAHDGTGDKVLDPKKRGFYCGSDPNEKTEWIVCPIWVGIEAPCSARQSGWCLCWIGVTTTWETQWWSSGSGNCFWCCWSSRLDSEAAIWRTTSTSRRITKWEVSIPEQPNDGRHCSIDSLDWIAQLDYYYH